MSESRASPPSGWERWKGNVPTLSLLIAILVFVLGGGFVVNEWRKPNLTYQVLPTYELADQAFSGVIVSNSGRSAVTDLELIIADLGAEVIQMEMPGAHEPVDVVSGGTPGSTELRLHMDRLSSETSLSVYLLTKERVNIDASILVTSAEMKGRPGESATDLLSSYVVSLVFSLLVTALLLMSRMKRMLGDIST